MAESGALVRQRIYEAWMHHHNQQQLEPGYEEPPRYVLTGQHAQGIPSPFPLLGWGTVFTGL